MWDEIVYREGCLSFPDKKATQTKRFKHIEYTDSIIKETRGDGASIVYGPTTQESQDKNYQRQLLESICVQHEIDHLYGIRILDRKYSMNPLVSPPKTGRNEPCYCGSGKKYKKCCIGK